MKVRKAAAAVLALATAGCGSFPDPGTPLATAAHLGDVAEVERLLAQGGNPNDLAGNNMTALMWAARGGHPLRPHKCTAQRPEHIEIIKRLLAAGANPDMRDARSTMIPGGSSGWTALIVALHHEQDGAAVALLQGGANPNIRSHQGLSALTEASRETTREVMQALLAHGADPRRAEQP